MRDLAAQEFLVAFECFERGLCIAAAERHGDGDRRKPQISSNHNFQPP